MIDPRTFINALSDAGVNFVAGVPDSLLKDFCACATHVLSPENHVIATNEGSAVGLAMGHYLASGRPAAVYMQNSGLGNVINPIASLADPLVYGIPMLLLVGWRGEILADGAQIHDEPQHVKQGQITVGQLEVLDIPYRILDSSTTDVGNVVGELLSLASARSGPVALVVRKQTFAPFVPEARQDIPDWPTREAAIEMVVSLLPDNVPVVSTTGMASRELFELRKARQAGHQRDFLTVGGMGHASQIATGIAMSRGGQKVLCLDGDGALLMHMGGLVLGARQPNLVHIVLNNQAHDSVGGQPTPVAHIDLTEIAKACGYGYVASASMLREVETEIGRMLAGNCSGFLEIKCRRGARSNLGRPDRTPAQNKAEFMNFLRG